MAENSIWRMEEFLSGIDRKGVLREEAPSTSPLREGQIPSA